jgi:hypothetical protein
MTRLTAYRSSSPRRRPPTLPTAPSRSSRQPSIRLGAEGQSDPVKSSGERLRQRSSIRFEFFRRLLEAPGRWRGLAMGRACRSQRCHCQARVGAQPGREEWDRQPKRKAGDVEPGGAPVCPLAAGGAGPPVLRLPFPGRDGVFTRPSWRRPTTIPPGSHLRALLSSENVPWSQGGEISRGREAYVQRNGGSAPGTTDAALASSRSGNTRCVPPRSAEPLQRGFVVRRDRVVVSCTQSRLAAARPVDRLRACRLFRHSSLKCGRLRPLLQRCKCGVRLQTCLADLSEAMCKVQNSKVSVPKPFFFSLTQFIRAYRPGTPAPGSFPGAAPEPNSHGGAATARRIARASRHF